MVFVLEYSLGWDALDTVVARRMEWEAAKPKGLKYIGEWVWQNDDPPFRGIAVVEADDIEDLNTWVLHYGPTIRAKIHPATDVGSALTHALGRAPAKK